MTTENSNYLYKNLATLLSLLFVISFIEGGLVMALELISAKVFLPYFGGSIYIWAALLAVSLGGLASGYFVGGKLAVKKQSEVNVLLYITFFGVLSLLPIVFFNSFILNLFIQVNLKIAVLVCSLLLLFPAMLCFGAISPIIIKIINQQGFLAAKSSAYIYTISTFGGVCFTLLFGFYLIPYKGLQSSLLYMLASFFACVVLAFFVTKKINKQ